MAALFKATSCMSHFSTINLCVSLSLPLVWHFISSENQSSLTPLIVIYDELVSEAGEARLIISFASQIFASFHLKKMWPH